MVAPACSEEHPGANSLMQSLSATFDRFSRLRADRQQACASVVKAEIDALRVDAGSSCNYAADLERMSADSDNLLVLRERALRATNATILQEKELASQAEAAANARQQAQDAHASEASSCQGYKTRLHERSCAHEKAKEDTQSFLHLYQERLGFCIERVAPRSVKMSFRDLQGPQMEHSFVLSVVQSEPLTYEVSSCKPRVPELSDLVARLNENSSGGSSLARFVCAMRRAFIASSKPAPSR